ncbi:hypothetical protein B7463_g5324, partial [Scytalidium lignicola]
MSGFKDTIKGGWHPKGKDGKSKESWRGDFKGINQVAGWMGKGKDPKAGDSSEERIARPLSTLKDPALFGPPPKNVNYHGGAALPHKITPDTRGLGAPLTREQIQAKQEAEEEEARRQAEEEEEKMHAGPPVPYRADTTGLSTSNLPPPPGRKDGADGRTPVVQTMDRPKPPGLPPRLPPRQNSSTVSSPRSNREEVEPPSHRGILNQGSLNRLGAAGISVPGFGVGGSPNESASPALSPRTSATSPQPVANTAQLNELQSRFSRLSTPTASNPDSPSEGTSFSQKQAAFKTASSFRKDPSSVSFSDMKNAASTANNFRERHGEQVASGLNTANNMNTKYGVTNKIGSYGGTRSPEPEVGHQIDMRDNTVADSGTAITASKKKPPPPPPKKRADLAGSSVSSPPVPVSTRPNFPMNNYQ